MKSQCIFLFIFSFSCLFANSGPIDSDHITPLEFEEDFSLEGPDRDFQDIVQNLQKKKEQIQNMKNPPGSYTLPLQKGHIFLEGEYLYWKPYAFIPFAIRWEKANTGPTILTNEALPQLSLKAHSGYRLQLGLYLPPSSWYLSAQYTQFFARGSDFLESISSVGINNVGTFRFFCPWIAEEVTSTINGHRDASATQRIRVKTIDGMICRSFVTNSCFTFDPFFGVRYARIKIDMNILFREQQTSGSFIGDFGTDDIDLTNDFNSFGLRFGFKTNWLMGWGFETFGNGSLSTLVGTFMLRNRQNLKRVESSDIVFRTLTFANKKSDIYTNFQLALGLIWGAHFKDKCYLGFKAGYEINVWPDLIRLIRTSDPSIDERLTPLNGMHRNHFSTHGLTASAKLDF